jgi:hypothetical protein
MGLAGRKSRGGEDETWVGPYVLGKLGQCIAGADRTDAVSGKASACEGDANVDPVCMGSKTGVGWCCGSNKSMGGEGEDVGGGA